MLTTSSISDIGSKLKKQVESTETDYTFNHLTSFSRKDVLNMLAKAGFEAMSLSYAEVASQFGTIPGLEVMKSISAYYVAKPTMEKNLSNM